MKILKKPFPAMAGGLLTPLALVLAVTLVGRVGSQSAYAQRPAASTPSAQISAGSPSDFRDDRVGMDMVFVEGGTFTMGCTPEQSSDCDDDERPLRSITVGNFYIGKHEVTQRLWKQVMDGSNPSHFKGDNLPVENVSWNDVQTFISRLNSMTGRRYRLPTEAEWEYAARGGNRSRGFLYSGSNDINEAAWYHNNSGNSTHPVGTRQANELGIHDMSGNVWEWVSDWYGNYPGTAETNPTGPTSGSDRVGRGGRWYGAAMYCRVSYRNYETPGYRNFTLGFRLALAP